MQVKRSGIAMKPRPVRSPAAARVVTIHARPRTAPARPALGLVRRTDGAEKRHSVRRDDRTAGDGLRQRRHLRSRRVLCNDDGTPLTRQGAGSRVRYAAKWARVPTGVHILCHTFCSHLAMQGAPMRGVQERVGHQSLAMTQRYSHLTPAVLDAPIKLLENRLMLRSAWRQLGVGWLGPSVIRT